MRLTIELDMTPEQERALRGEALRRGRPVAEYAAALLEKHLPAPPGAPAAADPGDRSSAFREWAAGHNVDNPLLAEEALVRRRKRAAASAERESD